MKEILKNLINPDFYKSKLKPDIHINNFNFHKLTKKGIQIKVNITIKNHLLKITLKNIETNIFNLDKKTEKEKNFIGFVENINNLVLESNKEIEKYIIVTIFWKYSFIFFPILLKKDIQLLLKHKISYETLLKSGVEEIVEIKTLNSFFHKVN